MRTKNRTKQLNIMLTDNELQELRKLSVKRNRSMSQIIRDTIFFIVANDKE